MAQTLAVAGTLFWQVGQTEESGLKPSVSTAVPGDAQATPVILATEPARYAPNEALALTTAPTKERPNGELLSKAVPPEELPPYQGPGTMVASSSGNMLYVANADARQIVWVQLPEGTVLRRLKMPAEPTGLALTADNTRLVVTCAAPKSSVVVLDTASGNRLATIPAGHTAMAPVISADGGKLYVCNRYDSDVSVIDLATGQQLARVPAVREPVAAALTKDGQAVLVANHLPNTRTDLSFRGDVASVLTVIDTKTHQTCAIGLPHGSNGVRGVCVLPDGKHALVTHQLSNFEMVPTRVTMGWINVNVVSVIDIAQRKLVSTIGMDEQDLGAGNPWDVTCSADGQTVCVSLSGTHELCLISTAELLGEDAYRTMQPMMGVWPIYTSLGASLWQRIALPGKGPRGLAVAGSKVYVAQFFSDSVAVIDLRTTSEESVTSIALGPPPQLTLQRRGELLFQDATICYQHWISCASCHPDGRADALNWDLLNDGVGNSKNTKSMFLAHQTPPVMAEGVRDTAEVAVRSGMLHILFADRPEDEAVAVDAYLRSLQPVPSPRLIDGQLGPAALRGRRLFHSKRVACHRCHPAPLYTDLRSHDVGTKGYGEYTNRFDTPTLLESWRTGPYLHDGRYVTVEELLAKGKHGLRRKQSLSEAEVKDLVEFVLSL